MTNTIDIKEYTDIFILSNWETQSWMKPWLYFKATVTENNHNAHNIDDNTDDTASYNNIIQLFRKVVCRINYLTAHIRGLEYPFIDDKQVC